MMKFACAAAWVRSIIVVLTAFVALTAGAGAGAAAEKQSTPPPSYLLQPGDRLSISVAPRAEYDCEGTLTPDGKLYLKKFGEVRAAGLTIPQLTEEIRKLLGTQLRRPKVTVALLELGAPPPPDKITVVGGVKTSGPLSLEPDLRVSKAIELAGGATEDADLSKIIILHRDLTQTVADLSTPERLADPKQNVLLRDGDSVRVPRQIKETFTVTLGGAVAKTGPLTLEEAPRVQKALELAGGVQKDADLRRVTIVHRDLTRTVVDLSTPALVSDPAHNRLLEDGDSVDVPLKFKTGRVSISGAVSKPSSYELTPGMSLEDLIIAAGKLSLLADVQHVQLRRAREAARTVNLEEQHTKGRLLLEPGDEVHVPEHQNQILLVGAIANPGLRPLEPGQTVYDFLTSGRADTAVALDSRTVNLSGVQLIRKGEPARKLNIKNILRNPRHKENLKLASGDVLYLPGKEARQPSALSQLGFLGSLASLFTLF